MHKNEDVVRESELLGHEVLQPETVSHDGKGMTDLGDKSHIPAGPKAFYPLVPDFERLRASACRDERTTQTLRGA